MSYGKLAPALALGIVAAACSGGGGGGNVEVCPGTGDELVGACAETDGSCKEYRGAIARRDAQDDCASGDESTFVETACPDAARLRGSCSGPPAWNEGEAGTLVAFEPREEGYLFKLICVEAGGCYDATGRDDDACYGTTDTLVGSCLHESGRCLEYRGGIDEGAARGQCDEEPAGEFRDAACPESTRASGSCSAASHGGTAVMYHEALTPEELEQLCTEEEVCYQAP